MANDFNSELNISVKGSDTISRATEAIEKLDASMLKAAESAEKLDAEMAKSKSTGAASDPVGEHSKAQEQARKTGVANSEAAKESRKAWKENYDTLSNTRYALYDVAALYGTVGVAAGAVVASISGVAASYEKSFADVARTTLETGEALGEIRKDLIGLSQSMPTSFGDLTAVATLGAQLGIASQDIASFTETVSMFSATTDVTVERTAMSIGRLTQLTKTSGSEIGNLAAAIYQTGVTAVATEGEILSVAEQIATAGDLAGFSNHQIVALASSLASLGVAPESARGSMMRIFNEIEKAAQNGGQSLEKIAEISGMSTAQIQQDWGTDTQKVFSAFIEGMGSMQDAGVNTNAVLQDLGINAVRDVRAVQLLANNTEVYAQALKETAGAYAQGTALQDGYAIGTDTLIDQLSRLKNNLLAIVGTGTGFNDVLKSAIGVINSLLERVTEFANTPVGNFFLALVSATAMSVAGFAAMQVTMSLARAGLAAYITASMGVIKAGMPLQLGLAGIAREFFAIATGGEAAIQRLIATESAIDRNAVASNRLARGLKIVGGAAVGLVRAVAPIAALSLAIAGASKAWDMYSYSQKSVLEKSRDLYGEIGGLSEALAKDTSTYEKTGRAVRTFEVEVSSSATSLDSMVQSLADVSDQTIAMNDANSTTTESTRQLTVAIGEQTQALLNQAAVDRALAFWEEHQEILGKTNFQLTEYSALLATGGDAGAYVSQMFVGYIEELKGVEQGTLDAAEAWKAFHYISAQGGLLGDGEYTAARQAIQDAKIAVTGLGEETEEAARKMDVMGAVAKATGVGLEETADGADDASEKFDTLAKSVDNFFNAANRDMAVAAALDDLGESLYNNGTVFDQYSENGRANLDSLRSAFSAMAEQAGDDNVAFMVNAIGLLEGLEAQGVVLGEEFDWVYSMLNTLGGNEYGINFTTDAARDNIHKFIADLIKAEEASLRMMRQNHEISGDFFTDPAAVGAYNATAKAIGESEAKLAGLYSIQANLKDSADATVPPVRQIASGFDRAAKGATGTAKGAEKAAKKTKELKKEIRTSADYASDLRGVFDDITEIVFGLRNAQRGVKDTFKDILDEFIKDAGDVQLDLSIFDRKAAKDGIAQTFIDLKQAAADAKREVRDAERAVSDAMARMQGLRADEGTLNYQLMVAKELGSAERVAEIEAKIAQNKADQAKAADDIADAQEREARARAALSTKTTGNSQAAIDNRGTLRGMAQGYMEYIDMLRKAGVSESKIQTVIKQSEKDFMAQGEALGFTTEQLTPFSDGISSMSGTIDKNSTSLKGNEKQLDDLLSSHLDAIQAFADTGASQKRVEEFTRKSRQEFFSQAKQLGYSKDELGKYRTAWDGFIKTVQKVPSSVTIKTDVKNPSAAALEKFFANWNNKNINLNAKTKVDDSASKNWRKKNTGGKGSSKPIYTPVKTTYDGSGSNRAARKREALTKYWDYTAKAMRAMDAGDFKRSEAMLGQASKWKRTHDSFATGGFTGRGGKYEEAGIAHKGEFYFPQEDVNQSTGKPKPEVLQAMLADVGYPQSDTQGGQLRPSVSNTPPIVNNSVTLSDMIVAELLPSQINQIGIAVAAHMPELFKVSDIVNAVNQTNIGWTSKGQG